MTPLYTRITTDLIPALLAAMPIDCNGQKWTSRSEGICTFARRTDERQEYLYGPLWPHTAAREFVVLDDAYNVQFAIVPGNSNISNTGFGLRISNEYDIQLVVASYHWYPTVMTRIQKALDDLVDVQLLSIDTNTLRNAQRFVQPDSDTRGIDPERFIFLVNIKYILNFNVTNAELAQYE